MAALPIIAAVATVASSGLQAMGAIQQGKAQKQAMEMQAKEQERQAKAEVAAAQREAITKRQEGAQVLSKQRAIAGASGAGVTNPSILDLYGETAEAADLNAQMALYGGKDRATGLKAGAAASRFKGQAAYSGSILEGIGAGLGGIGKLGGMKFG